MAIQVELAEHLLGDQPLAFGGKSRRGAPDPLALWHPHRGQIESSACSRHPAACSQAGCSIIAKNLKPSTKSAQCQRNPTVGLCCLSCPAVGRKPSEWPARSLPGVDRAGDWNPRPDAERRWAEEASSQDRCRAALCALYHLSGQAGFV